MWSSQLLVALHPQSGNKSLNQQNVANEVAKNDYACGDKANLQTIFKMDKRSRKLELILSVVRFNSFILTKLGLRGDGRGFPGTYF